MFSTNYKYHPLKHLFKNITNQLNKNIESFTYPVIKRDNSLLI